MFRARLALRPPAQSGAELQSQEILRAFAGATAHRGSAVQSQCQALHRYVGLFLDRLRDFNADAGLGDVNGAAVDELVPAPAVVPDDRGRRRICGTRVPAELALSTHKVCLYVSRPFRISTVGQTWCRPERRAREAPVSDFS